MSTKITASELFALSQRVRCEGSYECHWCSSPCKSLWVHDDVMPYPFVKRLEPAKRISNPYVCLGCWLYRRKRVTVNFLDGTLKDRQSPREHSWYFTKQEAYGLIEGKSQKLYASLLNPPLTFSLSLV